MEIKDGYGSKPIRIYLEPTSELAANLWIEFGCQPKKETLSFITLYELIELKKEIQKAIIKIVKN